MPTVTGCDCCDENSSSSNCCTCNSAPDTLTGTITNGLAAMVGNTFTLTRTAPGSNTWFFSGTIACGDSLTATFICSETPPVATCYGNNALTGQLTINLGSDLGGDMTMTVSGAPNTLCPIYAEFGPFAIGGYSGLCGSGFFALRITISE